MQKVQGDREGLCRVVGAGGGPELQQRCNVLRGFMEAVWQVIVDTVGSAEADSKIARWVNWAGRVADRPVPLERRGGRDGKQGVAGEGRRVCRQGERERDDRLNGEGVSPFTHHSVR